MTALMWCILTALVIAGGVFCAVLTAYQKWVAAVMFFVVWVIGVVGLAVQAVTS